MPAGDICLGIAHLQSHRTGISVELKSSAQFASSEEDAIDQLRQALDATQLTDKRIATPWIKSATNFRLILLLSMQPPLDEQDCEQAVKMLSVQLQDAKMWQQLRLKLSSVQSSCDDTTGVFSIAAHLTHDDTTPSLECKFHKLGMDVPFHDLRPPHGFSEVSCESVMLSFLVEASRGRKRRADEAFEDLDPGVSLRTEAGFPVSRSTGDVALRCRQGIDLELGDHLWISNTEDTMLDEPDAPGLQDRCDVNYERILQSSVGAGAGVLVQHAADSACKSFSRCHDVHDYVQILGTALQVAVCGSSRLAPPGEWTSESSSIYPLADAIPSMWSPDYFPNVASRAVLLPTIAHALGSVLRPVDDASENSLPSWLETPQEQVQKEKVDCPDGRKWSHQLWARLQTDLFCKDAAHQLNFGRGSAEHATDVHAIARASGDGFDNCRDEAESLVDKGRGAPVGPWHGLLEDEFELSCAGESFGIPRDREEHDTFYDIEHIMRLRNADRSALREDLVSESCPCPSTPEDHLGPAPPELSVCWQSVQSTTRRTTSQSGVMPSHGKLRTGGLQREEVKQPRRHVGQFDAMHLVKEEGHRPAVRDDSVFRDRSSNEILTLGSGLQNSEPEGFEMLDI